MKKKAYLVLENGQVFEGERFGADGETTGEVVFATGLVGYLETLTDPSYYGQIVIQTFPLIGNYGVIPADFESQTPVLRAYIVREWCEEPSNFRSEGDIDAFMKEKGVIGLCGIDTRALTRIIREHGVMNARLVDRVEDLEKETALAKAYRVTDAVKNVSGKSQQRFTAPDAKYEVVVWDFGVKANIPRELVRRGCNVTVVPYDTTAEQISRMNPDGVMLTNGPGDPAENTGVIAQLAALTKTDIPIFGICMGHQLLALSQGAKTKKMKYGHRGANQPVKDLQADRVYVTSQNHGYAVDIESLPEHAKLAFININDNTCEGIRYTNIPAFSVQFHPEACAGPLDTMVLFDRFLKMMDEKKEKAR